MLTSRRGQSLVEFALVVPVLLLLLCGTIEYGRLWGAKNVLITAARDGARLKAVNADDADVQDRVQALLDAENLPLTSLDISGPSGSAPTRMVTVSVQSDVPTFFGGLLPGVANPMSLTAEATMRFEEGGGSFSGDGGGGGGGGGGGDDDD